MLRRPADRIAAVLAGLVVAGLYRNRDVHHDLFYEKPVPHSDVLVVGGGIVGTSLSYFLTSKPSALKYLTDEQEPQRQRSNAPLQSDPKPLTVTLLERQTIASESSGLSAGTIWTEGRPKTSLPPTARGNLTFRNLSSLLYKDLQTNKKLDIDYVQCGAVQLAMTPAERDLALTNFTASSSKLCVPSALQFFPSNAAVRRGVLASASDAVLAATYAPLGGTVDGPRATHALCDLAREQGATVVEGCEVKSIRRRMGSGRGGEDKAVAGYVVEAVDGRTFTADHVVVASGAWVDEILPEGVKKLGIQPIKGQMSVSSELPSGHAFHNNGPSGSLKFPVVYFYEAYVAWANPASVPTVPLHLTHDSTGSRVTRHAYGRLGSDGRFYFGGDRKFPDGPRDYEVDEKALGEVLDGKVFKAVRGVEEHFGKKDEVGSWAGLMPFSEDAKPIVEELGENLWVAGGFSASGMMDGPGAMLLLSEWMRARVIGEAEERAGVIGDKDWKKNMVHPLLVQYHSRPREASAKKQTH